MTRPVFLTGMMACGKSTAGHLLARERGAPFIDLDHRIERLFGESVEALFARGESRFRDRERAALQSLLLEPAFGRQSVVVATGGGVVMDPANREDMARAGTIIFLDVPLDELVGRLRAQGEAERRPLVASAGIAMRRRLAVLMAARRQCYLDRSIVIDGRGSVQAVLSRLRAELGIEACRDSEAV